MIGMEFYEVPDGYKEGFGEYFADPVNDALIDQYHIQVNHTINNPAVFRFLPPLTIKKEDIDYTLECFEKAVKMCEEHCK